MEVKRSSWPRPGFAESLVLLAVLLAVDALFLGGARMETVTPHPFWAVVLLMAVQYGTAEALFAAALASLALRAGNLPPVGADAYEWLWQAVSLPLQWAVAGGVLGELRRAHRNRERALASRLVEAESARVAAAASLSHSEGIRFRLEESAAANLRSTGALYEAARKLERPDPLAVLAGARDLVSAAMRAAQFSIHLLDGTRLVAAVRHGWTGQEGYANEIGPNTALFHQVVLGRQMLSVAGEAGSAALQGEGLLAAPMIDEDGAVVGMLKIERMEFTALNHAALANFDVLSRWIAEAFVKAQRYQDARATAAFNATTSVLSYAMFEQQSLYLARLARRMRFPLSAVTARLGETEALSGAARLDAEAALAKSVRGHLRTTDLAFEGGPEGAYAVLLPGTPLGGAWEVARHLLESTSEYSRRRFCFEATLLHDPDATGLECETGAELTHLEDALERNDLSKVGFHA